MKVLVVHNSYQQYGGEDSVVRMESELLALRGDSVHFYCVSNDCISSFFKKLLSAIGATFSFGSYWSIRRLIRKLKPDVVHVHNFFPLISPSVFYACRAERAPVVFTLHNYRIVCPTALLMRDGVVTERSLHEGPWWALKYKVYRGSLVGTFFLCLMIWLHQRLGTWRDRVDRFIVLSQFAKERFVLAGLPLDRLVVKPNFVDIPRPVERDRSGLLFVGRLSPEKGVEVLMSAAIFARGEGNMNLDAVDIVGDGPLEEQVRQSGLSWLGALPGDQVKERMQSARALLLPSIWYEGFPMVLVEAYACGLPVIASRRGAMAELVDDGVTGLLFEAGDAGDLAQKMRWATDHPEEMGKMGLAARERYEAKYTKEINYVQLMAVYEDAIGVVKREQVSV